MWVCSFLNMLKFKSIYSHSHIRWCIFQKDSFTLSHLEVSSPLSTNGGLTRGEVSFTGQLTEPEASVLLLRLPAVYCILEHSG